MECICGKHTWSMDADQFQARVSGNRKILLDLGTGDGRFVVTSVARQPDLFGIGIDACRENLSEISRREQERTLFLIANALNLPPELSGVVSVLTVNFPWGSLLDGLLSGEVGLHEGMARICAHGASLEVRLNESAVHEAGYPLLEAAERIQQELSRTGFQMSKSEALDANYLKTCPTTWARKMAFGRAPHGVILRGIYL